jgi:hypothetical protein
MSLAAFILLGVVLVMATFDPHRLEVGKSPKLLTEAAYPKVFVHLVGGGMLFALFQASDLADAHALVWTGIAGVLYEVVQWLNPRGRWRGGVYTIAEAAAVALGAVIVLAWDLVW